MGRAAPGYELMAAAARRTGTSSALPRAMLMPGTTQAPHEQRRPYQAYEPTLAQHLGQSSRPSSLRSSSSGRIQLSGSRKWCAQGPGPAGALGSCGA